MQVSFEVRIRLADQQGRLAMLVRGNMLRQRGLRVLMPFGGGVQANEDDLRLFRSLLKEFTSDQDLRFEITDDDRLEVDLLFERIYAPRWLREAWREFSEEAVTERQLLSDATVGSWTYLDKTAFVAGSVRQKNWGEPMLYCVGVVDLLLPREPLGTLLKQSTKDPSQIEFVSPDLLLAKDGAHTDMGSFIPPVYSYLATF